MVAVRVGDRVEAEREAERHPHRRRLVRDRVRPPPVDVVGGRSGGRCCRYRSRDQPLSPSSLVAAYLHLAKDVPAFRLAMAVLVPVYILRTVSKTPAGACADD